MSTINENGRLKAYNTAKKEKGVPMYNVVINKIHNGNYTSYMAKGTTQDGANKLALKVTAVKAEEAINNGVAARGEGWD